MKTLGRALAVCLAGAIPSYAAAAPTIIFTPNNSALPTYTTAKVFRDFESSPDSGAQYVPAANETKVGDVRVYSSTSVGLAVDPDSENGNHFLSIIDGSYSVAFATPVQFFSFVIGTIDSYNNVSLSYANGTSQTFTGRQIIGESEIGSFNSGTSGRVSYDLGGQSGIVAAKFSSNRAALEIDDLASAVPEPANWAMMMLGLGVIGYSMRRRSKVTMRAQFA